MGACIGTVFILLGQTTKTSSLARSAVRFGFLIFGTAMVLIQCPGCGCILNDGALFIKGVSF